MQPNLTAAQRATLAAEKANQKALDAKRTADLRKNAASSPPSPPSAVQSDRINKLRRDAQPLSPRSTAHCKCPNRINAYHECTNFCLRWNTNSIVSAEMVPELPPPRPPLEENDSEKKVRFSMQSNYTYEAQYTTATGSPIQAQQIAQSPSHLIPIATPFQSQSQPPHSQLPLQHAVPPSLAIAGNSGEFNLPLQYVQPVQVQLSYPAQQHHSPTAANQSQSYVLGGELVHLSQHQQPPPSQVGLGPRGHVSQMYHASNSSPIFSSDPQYQRPLSDPQYPRQPSEPPYQRPHSDPQYSSRANAPVVWSNVGDITHRDSPIAQFQPPQPSWNPPYSHQPASQDFGKGPCIVCGSYSDIEDRRSGRKCKNCIGTSHKYKRQDIDALINNPTIAQASLQTTIQPDNQKKGKGWRKKFLGK